MNIKDCDPPACPSSAPLKRVCMLLLTCATLAINSRALADDQFLTIRATSALPDAVITYIAQSSTSDAMELRENEMPEKFIASVCGSYTDAFADVFYTLNPAIALDRRPKSTARPVRMPACVKWRRDIPVKVLEGDNLDSLLLRKIGLKSTSRLACDPKMGPRCNATFRGLVAKLNPDIKDENLDNLSGVRQLTLPLVTEPTTIRIKHTLDAETVRDKIAELSGQSADVETSVIKNTIARPMKLLAKDDLSVDDDSCKDATKAAQENGRVWPYDSKVIASAIERTSAIALKRSEKPSKTVVTLIDTGLTDSFLNTSNSLLKRSSIKSAASPYGLGMARPDGIAPFPDYDMGWHGTRVAEILTGASGLSISALADLVRINIANVVARKSVDRPYEIDPNGITPGINLALETARIANLSIGSETPIESLLKLIAGQRLLLVVAAGNERHALSESNFPLYPALYGGSNPAGGQQVITVAGYDGSLKLVEFSNWSNIYADIAAPACAIGYGSDGGEVVYGTSFAAPLVSFTAAVIQAFDSEARPIDLKNRLQASVDFDPGYVDHVLWGGRLNIAKALSLYEDVIEMRSPSKLAFGEWIPDDRDFAQVCNNGAGYDPDKITKIISLSKSPPYSVRVQHQEAGGLLITDPPCEPTQNGLEVFDSDNKKKQTVAWADMVDFVRRRFNDYSPSSGSNAE